MRDFSRLPPQVFTHCTVKHANVLAMPAMKSLGMGLGKVLGAAKGGAGRYMELLRGTKLQNLVRKHEMASELGNIADPPGVIKDIMRRISGGGLQGQIGDNAADVARQLQHQALGEAAKVYGTRAGTAGAGLLGGSAALQGALAKESASLPEPTCRGMTKKVTMPGENKQQPDLDPEGVQMSAQDYRTQKEAVSAEFNKLMSKLVNTPSYMNVKFDRLGLGGAGAGAIYGALAGRRGERLKSTLRGATVGGLSGLGAGAGMSLGGHVAGGAAPWLNMLKNPVAFNQKVIRNASIGGGVGGGLAGLLANNALSSSDTPDKEKSKKDDDKDVKEAAASVLAQIKRNHAAAV